MNFCSACGKSVPVRANGTAQAHASPGRPEGAQQAYWLDRGGDRHPAGKGGTPRCPGVGRKVARDGFIPEVVVTKFHIKSAGSGATKAELAEILLRQSARSMERAHRAGVRSHDGMSQMGEAEGLVRAVSYLLGDGSPIPTKNVWEVFNQSFVTESGIEPDNEVLWGSLQNLVGYHDAILWWLQRRGEENPVAIVDALIDRRKGEIMTRRDERRRFAELETSR
jgi:hypothetical protein